MKSSKMKFISYIVMTVVMLVFLIIIMKLNYTDNEIATAASKVLFEKAHVSEILADDASEDTWTEGLRLGSQEVVLTIDSGEYEGEELPAVNYLSAYGNVDVKLNTKVIVRLDLNDQMNPYVVSIVNYNRSVMILVLGTLFVVLLVVLGGKKGLGAILGLFFTVLSIWFFLIPLLEKGFPAIPAAILLVAITTAVSLVLLNGFSKKTFGATIGCIGGVTMAGAMAFLASKITPMDGFNMSEAEELVLRAGDGGLEIKGLLVSSILIASLGAVMDIAMTITSAIAEMREINPKISTKSLFASGLNIGRDAMGTMANTLILAFAGTSLNMLVLFRVFDYPYIQIFNSDLMAIEMIQGLSGSIGIILTVPLVAWIASVLYGKPHHKKKV